MPHRKLGHLQRSVLDLAERHKGRVSPELVYQELFAPRSGERTRIDAATRNSISRVLWSLQKRGLIQHAADGRGFHLTDADKGRS